MGKFKSDRGYGTIDSIDEWGKRVGYHNDEEEGVTVINSQRASSAEWSVYKIMKALCAADHCQRSNFL